MLLFRLTAALIRSCVWVSLVSSIMAVAQSTSPVRASGSSSAAAHAGEMKLDVVVRDHHGHAIRDLRADELRITDDGQPVKVTRLESGDTGHSIYMALVFDELDAVSARIARDAALEALKQNAGTEISFAVWRIHDRLQMVQGFTADRDVIRRAVETVATLAVHSAGGTGGAEPEPAAQIARSAERIVLEEHFRACPSRLLALTRYLGQMPGRKTILYFSDGIDVTTTTPEQLRAMIGSANRAGVSIYALDVSGLTRTAQIAAFGPATPDNLRTPASAAATEDAEAGNTEAPAPNSTAQEDRLPSLRRLAESTGGTYIDQWTNFNAHIERVLEDMTAYYEVTYVPAREEFDGRFRPVTVRTTRRHAVVQARAGYFALPAGAGPDVRPFEVPLLKALSNPERTETLPFRGQVLRFGWTGETAQAELVVEVPMRNFACADGAGDMNGRICKTHFSVLALVKDKNGQVVEKFSHDRPSLTASDKDAGQANYYTLQRPFEIAAGEYRMDVAVADRVSGKLSSKTIPFTVAARPQGVALSDVSLVRRLEPESIETRGGDPLEYQKSAVVPDLTAEYQPGGRNIPVFVRVYPDRSSREKPQLELLLMRENEAIATMLGRLPEGPPGAALPFMTSMKGSALLAGDYRLRVKATQDGRTYEQVVSFAVTGNGVARAAAPEAIFEDGPEVLRNAQRPDDAEIKRVLDGVRQRALEYKNDLTNFACIEVTRRSADPTGAGEYKPKDVITEVLQFIDGQENTQLLEVNGTPAKEVAKTGARVTGEFGALLGLVFSGRAAAQIEWKDVTDWKGTRVNVFEYQVPRARSMYIVTTDRASINVAYKGLVYIDTTALAVRRITLEAVDLPPTCAYHKAEIAVDYDWVRIAGHDYLLPQTTTLYTASGKHHLEKTEKEFRDFRRYDVGAEWQAAAPSSMPASQ